MADSPTPPGIRSRESGPLVVTGGVPLRRTTAVHSEHGEPLSWRTGERFETGDNYVLCRCGESDNKPFCDQSHRDAGFDAVDTADDSAYDSRARELGGTGITVHDDRSICVHAGFCGTRLTNIWKSVGDTEESTVRLAVINMVEKCPSGALTYRFDGDDAEVEPEYAAQIAAIDDGPLWVTGAIPVTTSTGTTLETRARVTLCRCGQSGNKPLCDGSHKEAGFRDPA